MINPDNITNFNRTKAEKEEFLLFCICVAGKSAFQQAEKLEKFLEILREETPIEGTPFELILAQFTMYGILGWDVIEGMLRRVKMGQYIRTTNAFIQVASLDVDTVSVETLETITGIGPKTARFFVVHSRPDQDYIVLDTHILSYLRERGLTSLRTTPPHKNYQSLELKTLELVKDSGKTVAEWDLDIWKSRRKKQKELH